MAEISQLMPTEQGSNWILYNGDCVSTLAKIPDSSIDFTIYSPPFSNLFVYSDHIEDMGNSINDEVFFEHYNFLLKELRRVMAPGRLIAVHCSDLPLYKWKDGAIGLKDFSGALIDAHTKSGFIYHSRITVWKSPVVEMQRTKAIGLLYMQLKKDSTKSRVGIPDYLLLFQSPGENEKPVSRNAEDFPLSRWQDWASPVWMDINQTNTLNAHNTKDPPDERHIAPLQLDLIERALILWTNPNDVVLSPFAGIGSEGYMAIKLKRRFVGIELKPRYFKTAVRNLRDAEAETSGGLVSRQKILNPP
jgi:DNA modification methylase